MQFKPIFAACIAGLVSFALAAPAPDSKMDAYNKILPFQLHTLENFRQFVPDLTPEKLDFLDKLSDKLKHPETSKNLEDLEKFLDEGREVFKNPVIKSTDRRRGNPVEWYNSARAYDSIASQARTLLAWMQ